MTSEERKRQFRESQQRRRKKLAEGNKRQISVYILPENLELIDGWCERIHLERNDFFNGLLYGLSLKPDLIPQLILRDA